MLFCPYPWPRSHWWWTSSGRKVPYLRSRSELTASFCSYDKFCKMNWSKLSEVKKSFNDQWIRMVYPLFWEGLTFVSLWLPRVLVSVTFLSGNLCHHSAIKVAKLVSLSSCICASFSHNIMVWYTCADYIKSSYNYNILYTSVWWLQLCVVPWQWWTRRPSSVHPRPG